MYKKIYFKTLPSTNQFLKEHYKDYQDKTVVICNYQSKGRGRFGRIWEMEENGNIAMSILLKPKIRLDRISQISLLTSAAIFNVISKYAANVTIKWPNDILVNGKKICGVLLESIISTKLEALIVGIGLNLNYEKIPSHLEAKATSLYLETQQKYNKEDIINNIINEFEKLYQNFLIGQNDFLNICKQNSIVIGKYVKINGNYVYVEDIKDNGNIVVTNGLEEKEYAYGEVSIDYNFSKEK